MAEEQERSKEEEQKRSKEEEEETAAEIESKQENEAESRNEDEAKEEENERESSGKEMMKPWEQHANVISIPRFDYNAPSALLLRSHSGFLITCSIKREKSATKEAISILEKYLGSYNCGSSENLENTGENTNAKRRKRTEGEIGGTFAKVVEDTTAETDFGLSLVKLTRSGLLLFTLLGKNSPDSVDIVSKIFQCLESGNLKSPLWCHRIFPIQATCNLNEKELRTVVSKLVLQFMNTKRCKLGQPIKFAVGYNRRGTEETQMKIAKAGLKVSELFPLLDRNKCFDVVASAVKDAIFDSIVDLKSPELSVLVELLPVSGVPSSSLVAAISVLPQNLVSTKPRLCIRPLISDANERNEKNKPGFGLQKC